MGYSDDNVINESDNETSAEHSQEVHHLSQLISFQTRFFRACLITLQSNFEIFQKGHPAVEVMLDRRIFER